MVLFEDIIENFFSLFCFEKEGMMWNSEVGSFYQI